MTFDQLLALLQTDLLPLLAKFFLLVIILLYGIFVVVLLRQVQLMNKVVTEVNFSPVLFTVALLNFLAVVLVFILALILV